MIKQYVNLLKPDELRGTPSRDAGTKITYIAKFDRPAKSGEKPPFVTFVAQPGSENMYKRLDDSTKIGRALKALALKAAPGLNVIDGRIIDCKRADDKGEVTFDWVIPPFGGDQYTPTAHISLGSEEAKPGDTYEVWRKLYLSTTAVLGGPKAKHRVGRFADVDIPPSSDLVKEFKKLHIEVVEKAEGKVSRGANIPASGSEGAAIALQGGYKHPPGEPEVRVVHVFNLASPSSAEFDFEATLEKSIEVDLPEKRFIDESREDPDDWLDVAGYAEFKYTTTSGAPASWPILSMFIEGIGPSKARFKLDDAGKGSGIAPTTKGRVHLKYRARHLGTLGYSIRGTNIVLIAQTHPGDPDEKLKDSLRQEVLGHEIGHAIGMVDEKQPTHYPTMGSHKGPHCYTGLSGPPKFDPKTNDCLTRGTCAMFGSLVSAEFCDDCTATACVKSIRVP